MRFSPPATAQGDAAVRRQRLAELAARRPWVVVICAAVLTAAAAVVGAGVVPSLQAAGFTDPAAESTRAGVDLAREFGTADPGLVIVVSARRGTVDRPDVTASGRRLTAALRADPAVSLVESYWDDRSPLLVSRSRTRALLLGVIAGDVTQRNAAIDRLRRRLVSSGAVTTRIGGPQVGDREATERTLSDLRRSELLAVPVTLALLVLAFGGVVAATLPLLVGGVAVIATLCVLRLLAAVTDVSVYALNLTTALGLGLGIDYALFLVSRYRDERRHGRPVEPALAVTMATAGRTVLFSAATVAVSLGALLLFPEYLLRSFAYAGIAVVAVACATALVVLPAVLALTDRVLDRGRLPFGPESMTDAGRLLRGVARAVLRHPAPIAIGALLVLAGLVRPALSIAFGLPDDRVLPRTATARQVGDDLRRDFAVNVTAPVDVLASPSAGSCAGGRYAFAVSRLPGVARVEAAAGTYARGQRVGGPPRLAPPLRAAARSRLRVLLSVDAYSPEANAVVTRLRGGPPRCPVAVTGLTAQELDTVSSIGARLPLALALVAAATIIALLSMTGSLVIPVKALLLSALSLGSTFGIAVALFQEGHLASLIGYTATGRLDVTVMLLVSCLCFGLSMDYEVFILSRVVEEHQHSVDTATAVGHGLEATGRIVTTAAALLGIVFVSLAASGLGLLQLLGWTCAIAVLLDATLIRALLLPALMRLMGSWNWWPNLSRNRRRGG